MAERENKDNRLKMAYNKKSRVCRLNNVIQAMKMLIAAIRFFRADDIRPYNDRNCSCPRNYFGTELQRVIALAGKE